VISAVQEAVYTALTSIENVRVYDSVPETAQRPYIRIGDDSFESEETKDGTILFIDCEINIYSDFKGYSEVKGLTDTVLGKLNGIDTVIDKTTVQFWNITRIDFSRDDDNTRRANIEARFAVSHN